ncbi:MAG: hypothetical protein KGI03_01470 [Patescibacteria group bacterium]|nr:hypothetical protein [Patescibacteria group bacterium]
MSTALDALLAEQREHLARLDTAGGQEIAKDAEAAENWRRILEEVWCGTPTEHTTTNICLAVTGMDPRQEAGMHVSFLDVLTAFEARLAAHQGQFVLMRGYRGCGVWTNALAFGIVTGSGLVFERTYPKRPHYPGAAAHPRTYYGAIALPVAPIVLFPDADQPGKWSWPKETGCSMHIPLAVIAGADNTIVPSLQLCFAGGGPYAIRVGDAEVIEGVMSMSRSRDWPVAWPVAAATIAEAFGRPIGTVPVWKEATRAFAQQAKRELEELRWVAEAGRKARVTLGNPEEGSMLNDLRARLDAIRADAKARADQLERFLAQWNGSAAA